MKAMILAAGLGSRMQPLTNTCPKPLLKAAGKALIDYHLERLEQLGIQDVAINTHWLSEQIKQHIDRYWSKRLNIQIFHEEALLETAGGIVNALTALQSQNDDAFLLINGDVFFEADLRPWLQQASLAKFPSAHLLLVSNPEHNTDGDFSFDSHASDIVIKRENRNSHTYSGIGLYRPSMFTQLTHGKRALGPILKHLSEHRQLCASELKGYWLDVGTPARLSLLEQRLLAGKPA